MRSRCAGPGLFHVGSRPAPIQIAVARAMRDYGLTISPQIIAESAGLDTKQATNALGEMHTRLRVQRIGDGFWELTAAGKKWLDEQERRNG